jgi:peptide/nickel transport system permease protein
MVRAGLVIVLITVLAAAVGPFVSPYDSSAQELARRLEAPSAAHPFGLDELGRDILARLLEGARISLLVGLAVVSVSSIAGMLFGSIAGYFGGRIDDLISRVIDVLMAFPGILLAIALVAVLGPSLTNVVLALSVIGWVGYARLVRGQALRAREFVLDQFVDKVVNGERLNGEGNDRFMKVFLQYSREVLALTVITSGCAATQRSMGPR